MIYNPCEFLSHPMSVKMFHSPRELVKWKNAWVMRNEVSQTVLKTLNPRLR